MGLGHDHGSSPKSSYYIHSYALTLTPALVICRLANANLVESSNRYLNSPTALFKYPTPNIPTTSFTSYRRGLLEMEWKRSATRVSTCTSLLLLSFSSFPPSYVLHASSSRIHVTCTTSSLCSRASDICRI